jgi:hypothetical protein
MLQRCVVLDWQEFIHEPNTITGLIVTHTRGCGGPILTRILMGLQIGVLLNQC